MGSINIVTTPIITVTTNKKAPGTNPGAFLMMNKQIKTYDKNC